MLNISETYQLCYCKGKIVLYEIIPALLQLFYTQ